MLVPVHRSNFLKAQKWLAGADKTRILEDVAVDPETDASAENNLSFIETSALDASNVESAFQTILTGECIYALGGAMCLRTPVWSARGGR